MSSKIIYRVADDLGPDITVTHRGVDVTGWTITARFVKPSGEEYTLAANVTATGDGADVPAEYNFQFVAGNLTAGEHSFEFHYSHASIDDYTVPRKSPFKMVVRDAI